MIDTIQLVRQWLLASSAVSTIAGTNVFGEALPEHYDPTSNSAIVISLKGGAGHVEIAPLIDVEVQIKTWAGINQFVLARSLYGAVYDTMHSKSMVTFAGYGTVLTSYEFGHGQGIADPDAGWATVVGTFKLQVRQDAVGTLPTWVDDTQSVKEYIDSQIAGEDAVLDGGDFS